MAERCELRDLAFAFLRSTSSLHGPSQEERMSLLRHFHDAFLRLGDVEGQLALRYEILLLCDKSCSAGVDIHSWIAFAEDCLASGFFNNALKAYERVSTLLHFSQNAEEDTDDQSSHLRKTMALLRLRLNRNASDIATRKPNNNKESGSDYEIGCDGNTSSDKPITATSRYMMGIKQREKAKLKMFALRR